MVNAACDTVARMYLMICKLDEGGHYGPVTQEAICKAGGLGICFRNDLGVCLMDELADVMGFCR